jgi:simple sugar transport system ATP-binding protein
MFDGRIMGERDPATTNQRELGLLMAGITDASADRRTVEANLARAGTGRH